MIVSPDAPVRSREVRGHTERLQLGFGRGMPSYRQHRVAGSVDQGCRRLRVDGAEVHGQSVGQSHHVGGIVRLRRSFERPTTQSHHECGAGPEAKAIHRVEPHLNPPSRRVAIRSARSRRSASAPPRNRNICSAINPAEFAQSTHPVVGHRLTGCHPHGAEELVAGSDGHGDTTHFGTEGLGRDPHRIVAAIEPVEDPGLFEHSNVLVRNLPLQNGRDTWTVTFFLASGEGDDP